MILRVFSADKSLGSVTPWIILTLLLHILVMKYIVLKFPSSQARSSMEITFLGAILEPLEPNKLHARPPTAPGRSSGILPPESGRYEAFRSEQKPNLAGMVKSPVKSTQKIPLATSPVASPQQKKSAGSNTLLEKKDLKYNRLKLQGL